MRETVHRILSLHFEICLHNYVILQRVVATKPYIRPFAGANANFLPLAAPNLNDVNESDGFALVRVELNGAMLASAFEVTVQTITGGSATGNACVVRSQYYAITISFL